jgi:hypothetical protein
MRFPRPALFASAAWLLACAFAPARADMLGLDNNEDEIREYRQLPKFRLAVDAGFSYWLYNPDSLSADYDDFLGKLERGSALSAQAVFFPWPKGGIGAEWIWFISHASGQGMNLFPGSKTLFNREERASFVYWGPTFCSRLVMGARGVLQGNFGAGYLDILDSWTQNGASFVVTAHNIAFSTAVDYDWTLSRNIAVGFQGRFIFSNINEYVYNGKKYTIQNPDDPYHWSTIPMYRLEAVAGLRFCL